MRFALRVAVIFSSIVPLLVGFTNGTSLAKGPRLASAAAPATGVRAGQTANIVPPIGRMQLEASETQPIGKTVWPANGSYVYVSLFESGSVDQIDVFSQSNIKGPPLATIKDGLNSVAGLFVDQRRNLWVANGGGFILEFPPGQSKPSRKIEVPPSEGSPFNLWIAGDGTIYGTSSVGIIKRTVGGKWSIIDEPDMTSVSSVVGDAIGDLFAAGYVPGVSGGTVELLAQGTSQWQSIGFPNIAEPGEITFDLLGRLVIANGFVGNVFIYDWTIPQLQDAFQCFNCTAIALNDSGNRLWAITSPGPSRLEELQYAGGEVVQSVAFPKNVAAVGMAVSPAFLPPSQLRSGKQLHRSHL